MKTTIESTTSHTNDTEAIAKIAAAGFGRRNDAENLSDTVDHIKSAEQIQKAYDDNGAVIGFALYRRQLWR